VAEGCGLLECDDLCVVVVVVEVRAFADDGGLIGASSAAGEHAADLRIGRGEAYGRGGETEGLLHEALVGESIARPRVELSVMGLRVHSSEDTREGCGERAALVDDGGLNGDGRGRLFVGGGEGKEDGNGGAVLIGAGVACDADPASVAVDELLGDEETF